MDDYTSTAKIEAILPKGVKIDDSTTDPPKRADVDAMVPKLTGQVNAAVVKGGGTAPLTGDKALEADLRCTREGAYQVLVTRGVAIDPKHEPIWLKWHEEFEEYLKMLAGVTTTGAAAPVIPGAPRRGADVEPWFKREQRL